MCAGVTFAGPTGTLWLDRPSTFTGKVTDFGAQESIDLPGIRFGVHTTLGYSENSSNTGGTLRITDGLHYREACASRQLHGHKLCHYGRRPRRHAHHGGGANGEPVGVVEHAAHGMNVNLPSWSVVPMPSAQALAS